MIENNIIHLPVDDGFPIQSMPLTDDDRRMIELFIKKSKVKLRRRERYAQKKALVQKMTTSMPQRLGQ
jgi:hypothetical protein